MILKLIFEVLLIAWIGVSVLGIIEAGEADPYLKTGLWALIGIICTYMARRWR